MFHLVQTTCGFAVSPHVACSCAGLFSESLALIDLLVLVHARHFTGLSGSSFTWVVQVRHPLIGKAWQADLDTPDAIVEDGTRAQVRPCCCKLPCVGPSIHMPDAAPGGAGLCWLQHESKCVCPPYARCQSPDGRATRAGVSVPARVAAKHNDDGPGRIRDAKTLFVGRRPQQPLPNLP